jgi:cobalamin synthase
MDDQEKRDRQMIELLNELRVALPGVQFLFAFLLTAPFQQGFQKTTDVQRTMYYIALLATVAATICLLAPSATHRLRFHKSDRAFVIESANKYLISGLIFIAIAIVLAVATITDYLYDHWIVYAAPAAVAVALVGLWFVRPLARHESSGP